MMLPSLISSCFLFYALIFVTHAFDLSLIQMEAGTCPYTVVVMTSCLSPESTRDQISIAFGDADGNQVHAETLGRSVRETGSLGKCSTDTFQVRGQCLTNPICSLYINRNGPDGWIPESIEIYSEGSKSIKFDFSKSVPKNTWYGQNNCNTTGRPSSPELPPPESPPETPAIPPPAPPQPSAASRRSGDGERAFLAFAIATAVAFAAMAAMSTSPKMVSLQLLTLLCFVFSVSRSIAVSNPHAAELFNASLIQNFRSCSYTVIITTSCSSPRYTRDQISLAFGDSYGNQIYAPRLDDPGKRAFERCSSDTYEINGPCAYQICYVYLYRSGPDGWVPESVKIFSHSSKAVTFSYNTHVPESIWYGFNYCNTISHSDSIAFGLGKLLLLVAVGLATLLW